MPDHPAHDSSFARARSYDDVAADYERISMPLLFDAPARQLVACAAPRLDTRVLDVGTGTGAVAHAAWQTVGPGGLVAAVDPSRRMLDAARRCGVVHLCAGALPDLPFADAAFDVVLSAFVLTHVDDAEAAMREMHRVLRPGGRIALSAWGTGEDPYTSAWTEVAHEFVEPGALTDAVRRVLPGEVRFSTPDGLARLLTSEGFVAVRVETVAMGFALSTEEFVVAREVGASGRALRALLGAEQWTRCRDRARSVLGARFRDGVRYERPVYFTIADRPA